MQPSHQELTKPQTQDLPAVPDSRILGLIKNKKLKKREPSLAYSLAENADLVKIDKAFDILFEETLHQKDDLTAMNN